VVSPTAVTLRRAPTLMNQSNKATIPSILYTARFTMQRRSSTYPRVQLWWLEMMENTPSWRCSGRGDSGMVESD
jgi:hypothetical protein